MIVILWLQPARDIDHLSEMRVAVKFLSLLTNYCEYGINNICNLGNYHIIE